jgi:hypothetical protein
MTHPGLCLGFSARTGAICAILLFASPAFAQDKQKQAPPPEEDSTSSVFSYVLEGFGTGLAVGLAIGYLATGPTWESDEWRTLLWGGGIGALTGIGIGIALGVVDAGTAPRGTGIGFYIMRDSYYGIAVGALAGSVVGALYWAGGGSSKDVLTGLCWGTVIGVGAGMILGVVEGVLRKPNQDPTETARGLRFDVGFLPSESGAPLPYPTLSGRF